MLPSATSGQIYFTVHPEARAQGNKLLHYVDGASVPWPSVQVQRDLFDSVLGVVIDQQNRLWTIDHGNHGMRTPRLLAFDLDTGDVVHDRRFSDQLAAKRFISARPSRQRGRPYRGYRGRQYIGQISGTHCLQR